MQKKILSILLIVILSMLPLVAAAESLVPLPDSAQGTTSPPSITANGGVLVDLQTNTLLYTKNADAQCAPASLTKMMTLLVSFENCADPATETITVPKEAMNISADSSRAYIETGDVISVKDMFYAMMLPSGNDAAIALAMHFGKSISGFADMMNKKAQELGMTGTHFENPHGLDSSKHYTTPRDLAILSCELARHTELTAITSTYSYTIHAVRNGASKEWDVINTNDMINSKNSEYLAGVKGLKTGYTNTAGNCLTTYYEKDGRKLVAVITNTASNGARFDDTRALLNYGLNSFSTLDLADVFTNQTYIVDVANYAEDDEFNGQLELYLSSGTPLYYTTTKTLADKILGGVDPLIIEKPSGLTAPINMGDVEGTITFSLKGEKLFSAEAKASRTIHKNILIPSDLKVIDGLKPSSAFSFLKSPKVYLPIFFFIGLVLLLYILFALRRRRNRRLIRRQRNIFGRSSYKRGRM